MFSYWLTQKLPHICTVILRIRIGKVAWFAVYICGNFWVNQYVTVNCKVSLLIDISQLKWFSLLPYIAMFQLIFVSLDGSASYRKSHVSVWLELDHGDDRGWRCTTTIRSSAVTTTRYCSYWSKLCLVYLAKCEKTFIYLRVSGKHVFLLYTGWIKKNWD